MPVGGVCALKAVGGTAKVNPARFAVPPGVVTVTFPLAPAPTTAVICVGEFTTKEAAFVPPNCTTEALLKFVPVIVTVAPAIADVGRKLVTVGAGGGVGVP